MMTLYRLKKLANPPTKICSVTPYPGIAMAALRRVVATSLFRGPYEKSRLLTPIIALEGCDRSLVPTSCGKNTEPATNDWQTAKTRRKNDAVRYPVIVKLNTNHPIDCFEFIGLLACRLYDVLRETRKILNDWTWLQQRISPVS